MELLSVEILVVKPGEGSYSVTLLKHELKINQRQQSLVLDLIDEKLKEIVKDFDLSAHEEEGPG